MKLDGSRALETGTTKTHFAQLANAVEKLQCYPSLRGRDGNRTFRLGSVLINTLKAIPKRHWSRK
jgi:hypothetical protein